MLRHVDTTIDAVREVICNGNPHLPHHIAGNTREVNPPSVGSFHWETSRWWSAPVRFFSGFLLLARGLMFRPALLCFLFALLLFTAILPLHAQVFPPEVKRVADDFVRS